MARSELNSGEKLSTFIAAIVAIVVVAVVAVITIVTSGKLFPDARSGIAPLLETETHSSVRIKLGGGSCSAVHIGNDFWLTAAHCTDGPAAPMLGDKSFEVLWSSKKYDVSLMTLPAENHRGSPLACRAPVVGEEVYAVTAPMGLDGIRSYGRVAGTLRSMSYWPEALPTNIMAAPGSSGGPLYDTNHNVLGLVVGGYAPWGNFAMIVPSSTICRLLGRQVRG